MNVRSSRSGVKKDGYSQQTTHYQHDFSMLCTCSVKLIIREAEIRKKSGKRARISGFGTLRSPSGLVLLAFCVLVNPQHGNMRLNDPQGHSKGGCAYSFNAIICGSNYA